MWLLGIDEAGYGPNLGPFVMSSVACRIPDKLAGHCLWKVLQEGVRKAAGPEDGRAVIDDSKVVYSSTRGLTTLETSILATLPGNESWTCLASFLDRLNLEAKIELAEEPWYTGQTALPVSADAELLSQVAQRFSQVSTSRKITWASLRSVVVCPRRFNAVTEKHGSKGAVLALCLVELLQHFLASNHGDEPVCVFVDKHGGRNFYAGVLQEAFDDGIVSPLEEGMERSVYRVLGGGRDVQITLQPRADGEHLVVALASMLSKYLREVLMGEFNRFWQGHVPGLKATAGYPGDAGRYYEAIKPVALQLGISESCLWRRK